MLKPFLLPLLIMFSLIFSSCSKEDDSEYLDAVAINFYKEDGTKLITNSTEDITDMLYIKQKNNTELKYRKAFDRITNSAKEYTVKNPGELNLIARRKPDFDGQTEEIILKYKKYTSKKIKVEVNDRFYIVKVFYGDKLLYSNTTNHEKEFDIVVESLKAE